MRLWSLLLAAGLAAGALAAAPGAAAPDQSPKRGGTVVFGPYGEFSCLNPLNAQCFGLPLFMGKVLEPAFAVAPDSTMREQLVSRATFTRTPAFTLTFEIHPDARWSDRVPITSRDFAFTHRAIVEHVPAGGQGVHALVRSVQRVGPKTVRVVLRSKTAGWRSLFPWVLPSHALRGQGLDEIWRDVIVDPRTGRPIGSGPFLLQSWQRGRQMTFVRNPSYWGPHTAYLDRIVFRLRPPGVATPDEILEALREGEVDMSVTRDPALVPELRRLPGVRVVASRAGGLDHLALRLGPGGHAALKSKLVRRALAYGIDRSAIARTVLGELDPTYPVSDSAVFLDTNRAYLPNWRIYRHRPALARRLLGQAGCRRGSDGIFECGGERLSLRLWTIAGATFRARTVELIQRQLREVGVDVRLNFAPIFVLSQQIAPSGAFDAIEWARFPFPLDAFTVAVYGCGGAANFMGYCQRLVTADLDQSSRILDAEQRARVLNRADAWLAKDVPVIPLYQAPAMKVFRATIRNVPTGGHELWNAENWWLDD